MDAAAIMALAGPLALVATALGQTGGHGLGLPPGCSELK
jgi:hypothetical protein